MTRRNEDIVSLIQAYARCRWGDDLGSLDIDRASYDIAKLVPMTENERLDAITELFRRYDTLTPNQE